MFLKILFAPSNRTFFYESDGINNSISTKYADSAVFHLDGSIDHDYSQLDSAFNFPSILSLHAKNDHLSLMKINLNLVYSADVKYLFEVRNISY